MEVTVEPIESLTAEARGLFEQHWAECGMGSFGADLAFPVDQGLELAKEAEANGNHVSIAIRQEGKLVGYILATITQLIQHNEGMFQAHAIYVIPELRNTGAGKVLIQQAESLMYHTRNIRLFCMASNTNTPIGPFLEKLGYEATDVIYSKRFKELPHA